MAGNRRPASARNDLDLDAESRLARCVLNRARADKLMDEWGLDGLVASTPRNVLYLSGWLTEPSWSFGDLALAILPRSHDIPATVLTVPADSGHQQLLSGTWMPVLRHYGLPRRDGGPDRTKAPSGRAQLRENLGADQITALARHLVDLGLASARLGFDDQWIGSQLAHEGPTGISPVYALDLFRSIRLVKTPAEVALLRAASRKTEISLWGAIDVIAAGGTAAEAARAFGAILATLGGTPVFILATPYRPGHGRLPRSEVLQRGDLVTFDATGAYFNYMSDIGRTLAMGPLSRDQQRHFEPILAGWNESWPLIRPGSRKTDLEKCIVRAVQLQGNRAFTACTVHSLGLEHTDHPHLRRDSPDFTIEPGMVLSVDLPWERSAIGKFHSEDVVYVRDEKAELLNDSNNQIFVLEDGCVYRHGSVAGEYSA